jgi:ABC-2 type transport system permease protein
MVMRTRERDIVQLLIIVGIILLVNVLSGFFFSRFDLTTEKRYTLTTTTKDLLRGLDDVIYVKVYLNGELPAGFRRLRDRTRETLDEFRAFSGNRIEYQFIDPADQPDDKSRNEYYRQLAKEGIAPTNIQIKAKAGIEQKLIFPGAQLTYKGRQIPVQLLKSQIGAAPEQMLNSSIEDLEYEITNAIRKASAVRDASIAFIEGHGELSARQVADMSRSLAEYYRVDRVDMKGRINSLVERIEKDGETLVKPKYKAIIIAKPDSTFSDQDKFILDQYVMYGGRVLWLLDPVQCNMDSLQYAPSTLALPVSVNLEGILFKYGARVNTDLLQDARCASIPGPSGYVGQQLQWALQPWVYFPIVIPQINHVVVKNLNGIKLEFASSIDTISVRNIKKTVLLSTSEKSRSLRTPVRVSLETMLQEPKQLQFSQRHLPVAVLLEGKFESVFKNRLPPQIKDSKEIGYRELGETSKMIVVSDGDIIRNHVNPDGTYLPCGFDRFSQQLYGNSKFILNAVNFLCDDENMTAIRSRSLEIRLLDRKRIEDEKAKWQALNVILPIASLLLFGMANSYFRRRKYGK